MPKRKIPNISTRARAAAPTGKAARLARAVVSAAARFFGIMRTRGGNRALVPSRISQVRVSSPVYPDGRGITAWDM